jgi:hypothetical protein
MTLKGFLFLLAVTVVTVMAAGFIAEHYTAAGIERTLAVGAISALVIFPAGRWAERRGWISGRLQLGDIGKEFKRGAPKRPDSTGDTR